MYIAAPFTASWSAAKGDIITESTIAQKMRRMPATISASKPTTTPTAPKTMLITLVSSRRRVVRKARWMLIDFSILFEVLMFNADPRAWGSWVSLLICLSFIRHFFNASSCRIGRFRFRCLTKVGMSECKVFEGKYYPEQNAVERRRGDFLQNRRLRPCSSVAFRNYLCAWTGTTNGCDTVKTASKWR